MGCLSQHRLEDYMTKYNLEYYFETGTGRAEPLKHAIKYNFKKCYTVDIDEEMIEFSYNRLKDASTVDIEFLIGKSTDILDEYVPQIPKESQPFSFLMHIFLVQIFISAHMKNQLESICRMHSL